MPSALRPLGFGHTWASGIHIKQIPHGHVTTITCDSCNMGTSDLPDMYALSPCMPSALGLRAYISGKSLVPMLQPICDTFLASCAQAKS